MLDPRQVLSSHSSFEILHAAQVKEGGSKEVTIRYSGEGGGLGRKFYFTSNRRVNIFFYN